MKNEHVHVKPAFLTHASLIAFLLLSLFAGMDTLNAQHFSKPSQNQHHRASISRDLPGNLSPSAAALLPEFLNKTNAEIFSGKKGVSRVNDSTFVNAFMLIDHRADLENLSANGLTVKSKIGNKLTVTFPVEILEILLSTEGIQYIELAYRANPSLDSVRMLTKIDDVHNGFGLSQSYTGQGVITGIVDVGFDYTHPTFYDTLYNEYRVSRVWNQNESGTPPAGFDKGNELIGKEEILAAQYDGDNSNSHGTHVAGIAAGSGGDLNNKYRGIAYNSEIVIVSTTLFDSDILDGVNYIFNYAEQVGKPAVVNLSIGGQSGPHDGNSFFDQAIDALAGEGKIVVGSAGNSGNDKIHFEYNFTEKDTVFTFIEFPNNVDVPTAGTTYLGIWGEANKDFTISVNLFNTENNQFVDYTNYISASDNSAFNVSLNDIDPGENDNVTLFINAQESFPLNDKPRFNIDIDNTSQDGGSDIYDYILLEIIGEDINIDAWLASGDAEFADLDYGLPIVDGDTLSTVSEIGGTGKTMIAVGSYVSKARFTNIEGDSYILPGAEEGLISNFSSIGPTADDRIKPDIAAPGQIIASAVSSFDENQISTNPYIVDQVVKDNSEWLFGLKQGTSMASPVVAGIVALLLEENPTLTPDAVKQLLQYQSITDQETGTVPNNLWGYGKIDALSMMQSIGSLTFDVTLSVIPAEGGTVSGGGTFQSGDSVTISASPAPGYNFSGWTDENDLLVSLDTVYKFKINKTYNLTANFALNTHTVAASIMPEGSGAVTGLREYLPGETATLEAIPVAEFDFKYWTEADSIVSEDNPFSFEVNSERAFAAVFELKSFNVTVDINPDSGGNVDGAGNYLINEIARLSATPSEGFTFLNWSEQGASFSSRQEYAFTVVKDRNLTANFEPLQFEIMATLNPDESGIITGAGTYNYAAEAELIAIPADGYEFRYWTEGTTLLDTLETYKFIVFKARNLVANMEKITALDNSNRLFASVYPNPTNNMIYIEYNSTINDQINISIFTPDGRLVKEILNQQKINFSNFSPGIYILKIESDYHRQLVKLIKN